ncbi:STM4015 family protein [Eleftheria terrae]|uniref:STM4015 family protein n=1 Tax=Eleftheria terrae TaxID=1597781 RepID=UPI00263A8C11|nr:STM4015 family protein [Eleftheria terrae]WKB51845.1 STM4015 family protein [Eleftheria terrae]
MSISERTETFFGRTVHDWRPGQPLPEGRDLVWRLSLDYDAGTTMAELLDGFLAAVDPSGVEALVIGAWEEAYETSPNDALRLLSERAAELPALKALFVGDMTYEECEVSWIIQGDYTALLAAFPQLQVLRIRGTNSLTLPAFSHPALRQLVIEGGGLPASIADALSRSSLPALEHLELWLGTSEYGFEGDAELYRRVLAQLRTPQLRYLGLRDSEIADELAQWLAGEAWIEQLHTLDLSLGTIGDAGAQALCASPHVRRLARLDLSHHYISAAWQANLQALGPEVVLDDEQTADEYDGQAYRYVAVGE